MKWKSNCYLCDELVEKNYSPNAAYKFECSECGNYYIEYHTFDDIENSRINKFTPSMVKNLIHTILMINKNTKFKYRFYYCTKNVGNKSKTNNINLYDYLGSYPQGIEQKLNYALQKLHLSYPTIGTNIDVNKIKYRTLFCDKDNEDTKLGILNMLIQNDYLTKNNQYYNITNNGFRFVEQLPQPLNIIFDVDIQ